MSLPAPYYSKDGQTIYCGDCRDILPHLAPVDLVLTDPPYFRVLEDEWDRQWSKAEEFLAWLGGVLSLCVSLLQDNGTLYTFASPSMAARVETLIAERARVIASCVWDKGQERNGAAGSGIDVTSLRTFWASNSERCIVAEKQPERYEEADDAARDASGYWTACQATKRAVFGDYLRAEFDRAGVTSRQVAALFPSRTGGLTGCVSNWLLGHNCPTPEQYEAMRGLLNAKGDEYLRTEYEELRTEYEELRTEYEELRRPFNLTAGHQWGDVWRWPVERVERWHPAQKPVGMIRQLTEISSRNGATILDPFMGSGTTLVAARDLGRQAIGIEIEEKYCEIAARRLSQRLLPFK
uniref:Putative methyltransferase n=2 Tax=viral metagenome TaxID=1070528 RepID=A0A6M3JAX5_9ZZZZ